MKVGAVFLAVGTLLAAPYAHAKDPCKTIICMAGKLMQADGDSECSQAIADYFMIVKFDRHGFNPGKTQDARGKFLATCQTDGGDGGYGKMVNDKYGKIRQGF